MVGYPSPPPKGNVGYLPFRKGLVGCPNGKGQVGYSLPWASDQGPPMVVTSCGDHWSPIQTYSFVDPPEQHLVVFTETEAHTISKRAVRIILECFLVCSMSVLVRAFTRKVLLVTLYLFHYSAPKRNLRTYSF